MSHKLLILLTFWVWLSSPVKANDRNQPIRLEADRAQLDQNTGISVYEGNVVVTQGSMRLNADKATIFLENGAFRRVEAIGQPARFRVTPEGQRNPIEGEGQKLEYDVGNGQVVITGRVRFTQNQDEFRGERVVYEMGTGRISAGGGGAAGRVQFTLQPRSDQPILPRPRPR